MKHTIALLVFAAVVALRSFDVVSHYAMWAAAATVLALCVPWHAAVSLLFRRPFVVTLYLCVTLFFSFCMGFGVIYTMRESLILVGMLTPLPVEIPTEAWMQLAGITYAAIITAIMTWVCAVFSNTLGDVRTLENAT